MRSSLYPWIIAAVAVLIAASAGLLMLNQMPAAPADDGAADAAAALIRVQSEITVALETLDGRLSRAAAEIGRTGLTDDAARAILTDLSATDPAIIDCSIVDAEGTLIAIEPVYHDTEGADLRDQPNVQHILASKRPIMSDMIMLAEGFPSVLISTPIFTEESQFVGFSSLVFRPEALIADIAGPVERETPFAVMVIQRDGHVLYETDATQIGRMTFEDPLYEDILDVARQITAERYGTAAYGFTDGKERVITWTTVGIHGVEWRVAVIRDAGAAVYQTADNRIAPAE